MEKHQQTGLSNRDPVNIQHFLGSKRQFRIREVATIIGMSERFAEDLFDAGKISGHRHNGGSGKRFTKTVPREWIHAYLIRTADYDNEMRLQMAREVLDTFEGEDLAILQKHISRRRDREE